MDCDLTSAALRFYVKYLRIRFFKKWVQYIQDKKQADVRLRTQTEQATLFFVRYRLSSCLCRWVDFVYTVLPEMIVAAQQFSEGMLCRLAFLHWKKRYVRVVAMAIRADRHFYERRLPTIANIFAFWRAASNAQQVAKICVYVDHHCAVYRLRTAFYNWFAKCRYIRNLQPALDRVAARVDRLLARDAIWALCESCRKLQQQRREVQGAMQYYTQYQSTSIMRYIIERGLAFVRAEDARRAAAIAKKAEEAYLLDVLKSRREMLLPSSSSSVQTRPLGHADIGKAEDVPEVVLANPRPTAQPRKLEMQELKDVSAPPGDKNSKVRSTSSATTATAGPSARTVSRPAPIAPRTQPRPPSRPNPAVQPAPRARQPGSNPVEMPNDVSIYSHTEETTQQSTLTDDDERLLTQCMDSYDVTLKEVTALKGQIRQIEADIDGKTAELPLTPYPQTMKLEILSLQMQREELSVQLERKSAEADALRTILAEYKAKLAV